MSTSPRNIDDAGSSADLPDAFQHGSGPNNTETPEDTTLDEEQREFQQFRAWRNEQRKRMHYRTYRSSLLTLGWHTTTLLYASYVTYEAPSSSG